MRVRRLPLLWCVLGVLACAGADKAAPRGAAEHLADDRTALSATVTASAPATVSAPAPAPLAEDTARLRLTSQGFTTRIWSGPRVDDFFIGSIRFGDSIPLRSAEPVRGRGCSGGFVPIEPRGWVCLDQTVTLAPDTHFTAMAEATRARSGAFPYRYALSNGAPMYNRVPTRDEQARFERKLGPASRWRRLDKALAAHEELAVAEPILARDPIPSFLAGETRTPFGRRGMVREDIPLGSMLSFTRAFEAEGRTWLLSADRTLVPADRVRPFRPSSFHGTRLGGDVALPIAWIRKAAKPRYRDDQAGGVRAADGEFPVRSFVPLTGQRVRHGGVEYLELRERHVDGGALYIAAPDATVVEPAAKLPNGVAFGQKWIHVRVTQGTLVAYEGLTPVYATLMSPGAGGVSIPGHDPVKDSTTPRGTFYVTFKDRATTMSPDKPGDERTLWIADVPYTQYFNPPFALHAAYWHERFGEPTSAGCVNVSPIDAEALFAWSDPPVPEGWQGATGVGAPENGPTTAIVVHR